ncbi:hypothetical protein [Burkholderia multivorans]|uniref:hypothetical protein n=1 Tax=Burkholderia multivorans TaxID=87883 RepID=UPI001C25FC49|nr:hypothetical protein [Burkholderia multivorans]
MQTFGRTAAPDVHSYPCQPIKMNLSRIVYSFGSPCNGQYGHLVLRDDGTIEGYTHPNEHSWAREADELRLHAVDGSVTSRFRSCGTSGVWIGHVENKKWPLHLIPVVRLAPPAPPTGADEPRTAFFVNSIPKSGTYYVEAALRSAGVASQRLHLSGRDTVHDNRDLTDAEIHVAPSNVLINCEVELVTAMLQGEQVVGHVEHQWIIDRMRAQGVCVLSVVRDLRNVITSLFRFKKAKVAPTDALDQFWRTLSGPGQVIGFLMQYAERDLAHIRTIAEMMGLSDF